MVEVWLRYGKTEVFADIPSEANTTIIQNEITGRRFGEDIKRLVEENEHLINLDNKVVMFIDYVAGLRGLDELIQDTINVFMQLEKRLELVISGWRYYSDKVEKELAAHVAHFAKHFTNVDRIITLREYDVGKYAKNAKVIVAPKMVWGYTILGAEHFKKQILNPSGDILIIEANAARGEVKSINMEAEEEHDEAVAYLEDKPDVIIISGDGYPTDNNLYSCMHIPASLYEVAEDCVIIFLAECGEGLGPSSFIQSLVSRRNNVESGDEVLEGWFKLVDVSKVCMVTALPATYVERLLGARHSDVVDDALTYAWRVKGRESKVVAIPQMLGTRLAIKS
ncbi:MAG: hypothetical protein NXY59_05060 [Aigarchaeota archaeon]|nr:hypothetical protein [Candidatus Pelearchaeum maunauluense]